MAIIGNRPASGKGVVSITRTSGNGTPGTVDTYTILYTDTSTNTFQVTNGASLDTVNAQITALNNEIDNLDLEDISETTLFKRLPTNLKAQVEDLISKLTAGIAVTGGGGGIVYYNPLTNLVNVASINNPTVNEGLPLVFNVVLSATTTSQVSFGYSVSGTAIGAVDYSVPPALSSGVIISGGNLIVPTGVSSFTVTYNTIQDVIVENNETIILVIGGVSGTGTINNEDFLAVTSVSSPTVSEGSSLVYSVNISGTSAIPYSFPYSTSGTAVAGVNYVNTPIFSDAVTLNAGDVVVPAGVTFFTVTYPTIDTGVTESGLNLVVVVGGVSGIGTINDSNIGGTVIPDGVTYNVPADTILSIPYPIIFEGTGRAIFTNGGSRVTQSN
jgi:hypothetical protein